MEETKKEIIDIVNYDNKPNFYESIKSKMPTIEGLELLSRHAKDFGDPKNPNKIDSIHAHDTCEIYINLTGEVKFWVEDKIYPITRGNVIITRPYEFHQCLYSSNKLHEHYLFLFSITEQNKGFFDCFFNRKKGENNLIYIDELKINKLIKICNKLMEKNLTDLERYFYFFSLIKLITINANIVSSDKSLMPKDVKMAMDYIKNNISDKIEVSKIAKYANVSINSLERHFQSALNISPFLFIKQKRLYLASKLLRTGESVTKACYESGFSDISYFIEVFKKHFGVTPYKYKSNL